MKTNYEALRKAESELRKMDSLAIQTIGEWLDRHSKDTSLESLARMLVSWSLAAQTEEQIAQLKDALAKVAYGSR